ncbi:MAG: hypothetical protein KC994_16160 [Candidatus Omnitrophica bacterium]|nr:hypothetical protein [Candidatus Omnitrophota bacterium]
MTTTTLTAPLTLCWTQIKILRWLLLVLVATLIFQLIGSMQSNQIVIATSVYSVVFLTLLAFFVGPVVFGGEHLAGASDYLRTRPVSPRLVFAIKILFVVSICLTCAYGVKRSIGVHRSIDHILLLSLYLSLGFWTSTVTILYKDVVRGFLVGSVSLVGGTMILLYLLEDVFHLIDDTTSGGFGITGEFFTLHLLAISPLVFFAMVSTADRWARLGKISFSLISTFALLFFAMNCFLPVAYYRVEGKVSWEGELDKTKYLLASRRVGDQILSVEGFQSHHQPMLSLVSREFDGQHLRVTLTSPLPEPMGHPVYHATLMNDRLVVFDHAGRHLTIYNIEDRNNPAILKTYSSEETSYLPEATHADNLLIREYREARFPRDATQMSMIEPPINILYRLNPLDGNLIRIERGALEDIRSHDSDRMLFGDGSPYHLTSNRSIGEYTIAKEVESGTQIVAQFEELALASISRNLLVAFPYDTQLLRERRQFSSLYLIGLSDPESPRMTEIRIPMRMAMPRRFLGLIERVYGNLGRTFKTRLQCYRGGDYLMVQSNKGKVGVWDTSTIREPEFIGLANGDVTRIVGDTFGYGRYPDAYTSFRRQDGALGFFTNNAQILWLEFPALMKEGNPS